MANQPPDDVRSLIEYLDGVAIWIISEPSAFEYVSAGAEGIWGVPAEELAADPGVLMEHVHPEDREFVRSQVELDPEAAVETSYENRIVRPDGSVRWVHTHQIPVRTAAGELSSVVGICTDVTDLKRREQELELLNRIVRHDIRNEMSIVLGWGEFLEDHVDEAGTEKLEKILGASDHVVELTEIARDYARSISADEEMDVHPVALGPLLAGEIRSRSEQFPHAEVRVDGDIPNVAVQANEMLASVFKNLLNNAIQHNDSEEPTVTVGVDVGDDVVVRVVDDGPGVPEAVTASLFERGTKGLEGPGTGMGLHLVQTLVDQFDGAVWATENDPRGTVFHVRLPRAE
ncbi:MAG: sensor histidine kinase [Halolamina sp.]